MNDFSESPGAFPLYLFDKSNATKILAPGQGTSNETATSSYALAFQYTGIVLLNLLSALCSGLVLGLLSLDVTDLEILKKCGTEKEREHANTIIPIRRHSNLLLCSLVIGNVVVNAGLQTLLDMTFPGLVGFVSTTVCITIFGEIVPQAICARHGLAVGANTIWISWTIIIITFPVSYPLSVILDCILGEEITFVYDRERLQEYLRITRHYNNLDAQEMNIIMGALKIKKVTVGHVMTKLKDVFMLEVDGVVNHATIVEILKRGFSRIPCFERRRQNVVGLLMVRDLALVDPQIDVPLRSLLTHHRHPLFSVDEEHTLDTVFNYFRDGRAHMALVREHKKRDIIGIVTLEDIIEEVLQVEIRDESDVVADKYKFDVPELDVNREFPPGAGGVGPKKKFREKRRIFKLTFNPNRQRKVGAKVALKATRSSSMSK